jgi:general secretion pathway protein I
MSHRARRPSGFTLLEVVVALAILAMSLMAIFDLNAGAIASHVYVKRLTVATLLARSKMTDLEQELYDKGFSNDDDEDSGDFSDEGWPMFKWRTKIIAPRTEGLSPQQLIGGLFNLPLGGGGEEGGLGPLGALFGGAGEGKDQKGPDLGGGTGGAAGALMGPAAGMIQGQFTQMVDQITKSVREVHLTVSWKEGKVTESIDLVTHVVSLGPGSDRNGSPLPPGQASAGGGPGAPGVDSNLPAEQMVNAKTGAPVLSPTLLPDGRYVDPSDPSAALITITQWNQRRRGSAGANSVDPFGKMTSGGMGSIRRPGPDKARR